MFGPETGVLVDSINAYYVTNGAADLPSFSASGAFNPGAVVFNRNPIVGQPAFWTCLTGGTSPTWAAGPTLGSDTSTVFNLTSANITGMFATPVAVLPAPGAGKALVINQIVFTMTTTSTAYTGGGAVSFVYHGTATNAASGTIAAAVITAGAGTSTTTLGPAGGAGTTVPANTGIDITNATQAFAAGTGTAKIQIYYSIITL